MKRVYQGCMCREVQQCQFKETQRDLKQGLQLYFYFLSYMYRISETIVKEKII